MHGFTTLMAATSRHVLPLSSRMLLNQFPFHDAVAAQAVLLLLMESR
jgi:hypothetical protein